MTSSQASQLSESSISALASGEQQEPIVLVRSPSDAQIRIDGVGDDAAWDGIDAFDEFLVTDPDILEPAVQKTAVRITYTDQGFYLLAEMQQDPESLVERLSSRDAWMTRDYLSFCLDTSGEGRYAFWFNLALGGSKSDGTILPERQFNNSWDGAWHGATSRTEDGWSAEFFIPWSIVTMPKVNGQRQLAIYVSRKVAKDDAQHSWPPLPRTLPKFLSAFQPLLVDNVKVRQQLSVFPYGSTLYDGVTEDSIFKSGVDVFWRPSTNLQLTATANPDFGTVEADDLVVNLTAYPTFFPEKRLFFLEGYEVFIATSRAQQFSLVFSGHAATYASHRGTAHTTGCPRRCVY